MSGNPSLSMRVARKRIEAESVAVFDLVSAQGEALPYFSPGAHIDVYLRPGLVRQYSLCNLPGQDRYQIAVLLNASSRGGSKVLHEDVQEGDALEIGQPRNLFPLDGSVTESILLAGGIGITPLLCMAESLASQGRSFQLHYCVRSLRAMAFRERIATSPFADRALFHCDDGPPSQRFEPKVLFQSASKGSHIYVCGPSGFMDSALASARSAGWCDSQLHHECFSAAVAEPGSSGFEIELASSGRVILVAPNQSAAEALTDAGIDLPLSCEQGICGTCITRIIAGEPDHRDSYLSATQRSENLMFTPCCSRSKTPRLVIDL